MAKTTKTATSTKATKTSKTAKAVTVKATSKPVVSKGAAAKADKAAAKAQKLAARDKVIAKIVALKNDGLSFRAIEAKLATALGLDANHDNKGFKAFRLFRLAPKPVTKAKATKVKATPKAKATRKGGVAAAPVATTEASL
jgi:hypothetical protein